MHGKSFSFGEVLGFGWRTMKDNLGFSIDNRNHIVNRPYQDNSWLLRRTKAKDYYAI
jgi:hypothetical protein